MLIYRIVSYRNLDRNDKTIKDIVTIKDKWEMAPLSLIDLIENYFSYLKPLKIPHCGKYCTY